jgi:hypothetical protein
MDRITPFTKKVSSEASKDAQLSKSLFMGPMDRSSLYPRGSGCPPKQGSNRCNDLPDRLGRSTPRTPWYFWPSPLSASDPPPEASVGVKTALPCMDGQDHLYRSKSY